MFQAFAGYTDDWTEDDFGFLLIPIVTMQVGLLALFVLHFTSLHL